MHRRRGFLKAAGAGAAVLAAPWMLRAAGKTAEQPNVLLLFSDQHHADVMGCSEDPPETRKSAAIVRWCRRTPNAGRKTRTEFAGSPPEMWQDGVYMSRTAAKPTIPTPEHGTCDHDEIEPGRSVPDVSRFKPGEEDHSEFVIEE